MQRRRLGCPGGAIFHRCPGKERDEAVTQQIEELMQRGRSVAAGLGDDLGIGARQDAGRAGQPHQADRQLRLRTAGVDLQDIRGRIDRAGGCAEPHDLGRVGRAPGTGQDPNGCVKSKAPGRCRQPGQHGAGLHARGRAWAWLEEKAKGALPPWTPHQGTGVPWTPFTWCGEGGRGHRPAIKRREPAPLDCRSVPPPSLTAPNGWVPRGVAPWWGVQGGNAPLAFFPAAPRPVIRARGSRCGRARRRRCRGGRAGSRWCG